MFDLDRETIDPINIVYNRKRERERMAALNRSLRLAKSRKKFLSRTRCVHWRS